MTSILNIKKLENECLKEYTTLKIGGNAVELYIPDNVSEILQLKQLLQNEKIVILGQGSNILVSSQGIQDRVIYTGNLKKYEFLNETTIKVESGIKSWNVAKILLDKNLSGLEFLIGIPGSLGGAVTMNSSAHGQAIEDVIESAEALDLKTNEIYLLNKSELKLGYRNSFVEKNRHLILNATFKLKKDHHNKIAERMDFHLSYRKERHPALTQPNAGSTFRNPAQGVYTGRLLEEMGAKNWQEGGAAISDKHCNFIINKDNATSLDVSRLMQKMHNSVKQEYGYDLIAEIRYIGKPTEEEEEIWAKFTVH
ncbi:MAG TPA: UDP-N-acetylmuramate dehydrogenase [Candidatus Gastranaerophilales bacterium]|nr:UDP-N-acetylmuramate dehydrogenase [Candidatus Gastranaerophilales bacterium]